REELRRAGLARRACEPEAIRRVVPHGDDREEHVQKFRDGVFHAVPFLSRQVRAVTGMAAPVTPLASSEHRNTMMAASSSALTQVLRFAFDMLARCARRAIC